jgi:hypothetical protein
LPGSEFGTSNFEYIFRLAYVNFDGKQAMNAAKTEDVDGRFIEKYCSDTIAAMKEIADWFSCL